MKKKFQVAVTKIVEVEIDTDKLDEEFYTDFHTSITDGADEADIVRHIAWNYVQGDDRFIEGIGDLKQMNVVVTDVDSDVDIQVEYA